MSGMKNINFKYLYRRTEQLLMVPETVWPEALNETNSGKELYRNYLIPITMVLSIRVLLINLINYNFWQATGLTIINLIAMLIGNWFAYLITREYLCRKLSFDTNLALNLTVYSGVIFIIFHSIGNALGNIFLGQLFTLLSFTFIRTLYKGLGQIPRLHPGQKTNILVISSLAIICIPVIINQLLMIIFGISAFNI